MSTQISLKEIERKVFQTSFDDGLWDVFLGSFFSMFAGAPFLSASIGDFWSSAIFLPVWVVVYLVIWWLRRNVVAPRIGTVKFGPARRAKLTRFTMVMLAFNFIMLLLGSLAALTFGRSSGQLTSMVFGLMLLVGFSLAAYFLEIPRLYLYGLLFALAPPIGEWLWQNGYASHHGFPLTFGLLSALMTVTGLVIFFRLLRDNPLPNGEVNSGVG